jgi:ribokinase
LAIDVLVVGNINIDLSFFVGRSPKSDEEVFARDFTLFHGGSAANFAVAVSRLGLRCGIVGCVGIDSLGEEALNALKADGVSTKFTVSSKTRHTGAVCVIVENGGLRKMIAYRGANEELISLVKDHLIKEQLKNVKVIQLSNVNKAVLSETLKSKSAIISLDPGGEAEHLDINDLEGLDILLLNKTECESLTSLDYNKGARVLSKRIGTVVVKQGNRGAFVRSGEKILKQPAFDVEVADTTGAGDAFDAGFIAATCLGKNLEEALIWGSGVAALKIQKKGARNGLPRMSELLAFLEQKKQQI